jgi:hypothetical protein
MEPTNQSFQELIGNGNSYNVPRFQRDYAWEQENWEDLWSDIESLADENYHYMGYIVLQKTNDHEYEIIDGQQRIVTLSLLVLAGMRKIKDMAENDIDKDDNEKRLTALSDKFVGYLNTVTLRRKNKLSLNRNNGSFFRHISNNLEAQNRRGQTKTNNLLQKVFNFFVAKDMGENGADIAGFIENISSSMIFTKIVVQDKLNAYKVFETLNARGVQLSTPDLLKNYIFSMITKDDDVDDNGLNELDQQWSEIVSDLGESYFTDFIRYHYNMQNSIKTKKELFAAIRKTVTGPKVACDYLDSLTKYAPLYSSLLNPHETWWNTPNFLASNNINDLRRYLDGFKLFGIKQPFTILMAAFYKFNTDEFIKLVKYLYILAIRYNIVCNLSPNEQEKQYNKIAVLISSDKYTRASHVKNGVEFKELYPSDENFRVSFEYKKMLSRKSSKKIKFLLSEIERSLGNIVNYENTVLEHICPYNPNQEWHLYFGDNVGDIQDRLGNVLLLDKDELGRANFETKKDYYCKSSYKLAHKISEYIDWNITNLNDYQAWLATVAIKTWSVDIL